MKSNNSKIKLGYGQGCLDLMIGEGAEVVLAEELPASPPGEIDRSIDNAVGKSIDDFSGCRSAVILASDITRPAPSHLMLPPLEKRLRRLGIKDLKIVFGLGTHRRMTADEERLLLQGCTSLPYMQHDPQACVSLGETDSGHTCGGAGCGRLLRSYCGHRQYRISLLCRLLGRSQSRPARGQLGAICDQEP